MTARQEIKMFRGLFRFIEGILFILGLIFVLYLLSSVFGNVIFLVYIIVGFSSFVSAKRPKDKTSAENKKSEAEQKRAYREYNKRQEEAYFQSKMRDAEEEAARRRW